MRRHNAVRVIAAGVLVLLLAASAIVPAVASPGASVSVSVTVRHALTVTFTESGALVSANGPWTLAAEMPGGDPFVVSGDACAGRLIVVPEGAATVDVYPR
jgi:hypothetical protein